MISCKIISLKSVLDLENILSVSLPVSSGEVEILSDHAEFFGLLTPGTIICTRSNELSKELEISGGFCRFNNNKLVILMD